MAVYPNPSSGTTAINFQLERASPVTVSLLDATGRLVRSVVREKAYPAGPQQLPLPLSGVKAGIYIVRLESSQGTRSEKLVVTE
jgi:hypothetical protein